MAHAKAKRVAGHRAGIHTGLLHFGLGLGRFSAQHDEGDCAAADRAAVPGHASPCKWPYAGLGSGHVLTVHSWIEPSSDRPLC